MGGALAFLSFLAPSNTTSNLEDLSLIKISVKIYQISYSLHKTIIKCS